MEGVVRLRFLFGLKKMMSCYVLFFCFEKWMNECFECDIDVVVMVLCEIIFVIESVVDVNIG